MFVQLGSSRYSIASNSLQRTIAPILILHALLKLLVHLPVRVLTTNSEFSCSSILVSSLDSLNGPENVLSCVLTRLDCKINCFLVNVRIMVMYNACIRNCILFCIHWSLFQLPYKSLELLRQSLLVVIFSHPKDRRIFNATGSNTSINCCFTFEGGYRRVLIVHTSSRNLHPLLGVCMCLPHCRNACVPHI